MSMRVGKERNIAITNYHNYDSPFIDHATKGGNMQTPVPRLLMFSCFWLVRNEDLSSISALVLQLFSHDKQLTQTLRSQFSQLYQDESLFIGSDCDSTRYGPRSTIRRFCVVVCCATGSLSEDQHDSSGHKGQRSSWMWGTWHKFFSVKHFNSA